jgi:ComF family protein
VLPQLTKIKGAALDLLFPRRCVGCGREGEYICISCRSTIKRLFPPICPLCGRPQASGVLCSGCIGWQANIDGMRSPFIFGGVIREAIHQIKYRSLRAISELLAGYLGDYLADYPLTADVLVPVPLHSKRLKERGYNQSDLIATQLSKRIEMPVISDCLVRQRYALPQTKTNSVSERRQNVADTFICRDARLKDMRVILIDDVATSGATLNACAQALKASGTASVWGLTLAREI